MDSYEEIESFDLVLDKNIRSKYSFKRKRKRAISSYLSFINIRILNKSIKIDKIKLIFRFPLFLLFSVLKMK
jgi:hypothetical protein